MLGNREHLCLGMKVFLGRHFDATGDETETRIMYVLVLASVRTDALQHTTKIVRLCGLAVFFGSSHERAHVGRRCI